MPTSRRYDAAVFPAPNAPVEIRSYAGPELGEGEAVLHTLYSEVCGTDVHLHHGRLTGVPYPLIPGHVSVGVVAESRGGLRDVEGRPIREGDRVTFLDVHGTCNSCYQCLVAKQTTRCPDRRVYGITFGAADGLLGGWSQAIWMKAGVKMIPLPTGLSPETFIGGGCGLVTAIHAVELARIGLGQSVAVLGVGPVGLSAVALASLSGADQVIAIGDPADRRAFAHRMGATLTYGLDLPPAERTAAVRAATRGHGVDAVIEATGNADAIGQALDVVRDGGRVIIAGHYTDNGPSTIHGHYQINRKHVELRGCWGVDYSHFHRAVGLATRFGDRIPWSAMVSARYPLARAGEALAAVSAQREIKALIEPNASAR
jgi:D-arabinose 1-dehydrogenase-like Zn-dependent alcohol dehydrogenase